MLNTPEKRKEFLEKVMDSPAFVLPGRRRLPKNAMVGGNDTRGISLRPSIRFIRTDAEKASFILYNNSGDKVYYGRDYTITYEDTDGVWRGLPTDRIVVLIAYGAENGEHKTIDALFILAHANLPGRYRFFS